MKLNTTCLEKPLEVYIDGPFGSPSSNIYRAEHAVLVGTGIGITPFASILQSIMHRYMKIKQSCPSCNYKWTNNMEASMLNLKKVDFIWINRDQKSFEWFLNLLSMIEADQETDQDYVCENGVCNYDPSTGALPPAGGQ